ncbi:MAG: phosphatase PAP2 family protein [Bacteroidales bacterium]|nr:phosphatase PAP2 family protein [Bacteroidales bacterium]
MENLIHLDYYLTLLVNGFHSSFFDQFFFLISNKLIWIPLYLAFIYIIIKKEGTKGLWIILAMVLVVVLSDQISSSIFKPLVHRLRPSHDPLLIDKIHLVNDYAGGAFGFVSSHAANTAGFALFLMLLLRNRWITFAMLSWTLLTSYSRVYLGVHFVGDVVCGTLVGVFAAIIMYKALLSLNKKYSLKLLSKSFTNLEILIPLIVYLLSMLVIFLTSV